MEWSDTSTRIVGTSGASGYLSFVTNSAARMRIDSAGNVGIGRTDPQAKLHVKGWGITIEDDMGAGRLGFAETGESDARIVLYRGGRACNATPVAGQPDITILRNFPQANASDSCVVWTILKIWAPRIPSPAPDPLPDREATLSLARELSPTDDRIVEFLDLYNNGYAEKRFGIRIQKRNPDDPEQGEPTAEYRDFLFDQYDGVIQPDGTKIKFPIMTLKADRTVWLQSHADTKTWTDTASIHATGAVKTTTSSVATLSTIPLNTNRACHITVKVVGRKSDGVDRAFFYRAALVYRGSGSAAVQGSADVITPIRQGAAGWACTFSPSGSGNEILIQVQTPGETITVYWTATIEYQSVSTDS